MMNTTPAGGLILSYDTGFGIIFDQAFFEVDNITYSSTSQSVIIYLKGFMNHDSRDNGVKPFTFLNINVTGTDYQNWFAPDVMQQDHRDPCTAAYQYLKSTSDWLDALYMVDGFISNGEISGTASVTINGNANFVDSAYIPVNGFLTATAH